MDITAISASQRYAALKDITRPAIDSARPSSYIASAANDFATTLKASEEVAMASLHGDADPHALVESLAQTELAVETAITVRNKVVEAYQEILRMPI